MNNEARNTKVVVYLVVAMTVAAWVLLRLEPRAPRYAPDTLLMAERSTPITSVLIEYDTIEAMDDPSAYDCIVLADGACIWQPQSARIRLLVLGTPENAMTDAAAETLLTALGSMSQARGLDPLRVTLDSASDPARATDLPAGAHRLRALLVRKGLIQ